MEDLEKYLKPGKQTSPSKKINEVAKNTPGRGFDFIVGALDWIGKNIKIERGRTDWREIFRKRTAAQIVDAGFATGCTDVALVFVSICRTKGIPTKYVEVIKKDWLEGKTEENRLEGHVFTEVYLKNRWYAIDPEKRTIYVASTPYRFFEIYATGLDAWDVGLHSFEELRKKFTEFKRNYKSQQSPLS